MDIREYISGGIIESYVLGLASAEESAEFERLCRQFPELVAARNEFEARLEAQAFAHALTPPARVRGEVLEKIATETGKPAPEARIVPLVTRTPRLNRWKYAAAAAVLLLVASSYFIFDLYERNLKLEQSMTRFQVQIDSLTGQLAFDHKMMADPNVAVVSMVGGGRMNAAAKVYWDTTSTDVYMVVQNMPQLPSEQQFQLWAFIRGESKPRDLGLFDLPPGNVVLKMKNTQNAEAFAITIEQRGNGPDPHGPVATYGKIRL